MGRIPGTFGSEKGSSAGNRARTPRIKVFRGHSPISEIAFQIDRFAGTLLALEWATASKAGWIICISKDLCTAHRESPSDEISNEPPY